MGGFTEDIFTVVAPKHILWVLIRIASVCFRVKTNIITIITLLGIIYNTWDNNNMDTLAFFVFVAQMPIICNRFLFSSLPPPPYPSMDFIPKMAGLGGSNALLTGGWEVGGSIPTGSKNIFSWRLIMKYFLRSFPPFHWFKKDSCQFLMKECSQILVNHLED